MHGFLYMQSKRSVTHKSRNTHLLQFIATGPTTTLAGSSCILPKLHALHVAASEAPVALLSSDCTSGGLLYAAVLPQLLTITAITLMVEGSAVGYLVDRGSRGLMACNQVQVLQLDGIRVTGQVNVTLSFTTIVG